MRIFAFDTLEKAMRAFGRLDALNNLQVGLPEKTTINWLKNHGAQQTTHANSLYSWRNGSKELTALPINELAIIPGYYLLSLESALRHQDELTHIDSSFKDWLPFLADGGGGFILLNLKTPEGVVADYEPELQDSEIICNSFCQFFTTVCESYLNGTFFTNGEGRFEMNDDDFYDALESA